MAAARKSVVSTKSSWFRRNSSPPLGQRRSGILSPNMQTNSIGSSVSTVVRPRRKRNAPRKSSTSLVNEALISTLEKESGQQTSANLNGQSHNGPLPVMSTTASAPIWLLRLHSVYRYSSVATFLFVAATLVVYGWTVYYQELWSQNYRTLQSLQRHERQLTTTNAALIKKMAEEGEKPESGLISPNPGETIFLPSTSLSPNSASSTTIPNAEVQPQTSSPLGY
jgi:hypothetical protein